LTLLQRSFAETVCKQNEQRDDCKAVGEKLGQDDVADDMRIELLQRDLQLKGHVVKHMEPYEEVTISKQNCTHTIAFQSTTPDGNTKSLITAWDPETGGYNTRITLLPPVTSPPFRSINSCAINPADDILYCSMEINGKGSFLVRIQDEKVGFVDKLIGWRFSATFDAEDNYYVYGEHSVHPPLGKMSVIKKVSEMTAWSSWSGLDAHAETQNAEPGVTIIEDGVEKSDYRLGADLAYLKWNLDNSVEGDQTYLASLIGPEMKLLRISPAPYELFTLDAPDLPKSPGPNGKPRVWGTAWSYRDSHHLYFSADDGIGLYATRPNNIIFSLKKVFMNKVGEAITTDWNDGISCGPDYAKENDKCSVPMYRSTTANLMPLGNGVSSIQILDPTTTQVKTNSEGDALEWKVAADGLQGINSCAINPKDHIIYCTLQFDNGNWIARLDSSGTIGYVMKVQGWNYAATFDAAGNYWYYENSGGLHKATGLDGYIAAPNTVALSQVNTATTFTGPPSSSLFKNQIGADLAILHLGAKTYLVSILETCNKTQEGNAVEDFHNRVSFVEITGGTAKEPIILTDTKNTLPLPAAHPPPGTTPGCQTWGSSWNLVNKNVPFILFAPDSGQGVYQLVPGSVNLEAGTMLFQRYSNIASEPWNNGFTCLHEDPGSVTHG